MGKYELTDEDKAFVDALMHIIKYRENTYFELCDIEVCNITDQYIIDHIYEQLDYVCQKEKEIMNYLKEDDERINGIIDYIYQKYDCQDSPIDDICVSNMDISNRDVKRALALINHKRISYDYNKSYDSILDKMLNNSMILKSAVDLDYYQGYLYFMQEYINDQMDLMVRRKLIQCKYNLYFLNPRLEEAMKENKFVVNRNLYQASKMTADSLDLSDNAYYDILHYEGFTNAIENIDNIVDFKEEELHKDVVGLLSFSAFVKSALLMSGDNEISLIKERTQQRMNEVPPYYYYKLDTLHELFETLEDNRAKSMRLSLRGS